MKVNQLDIPGIGSNGKYVDDNKTPGQERVGTSFLASFPNQLIEELQENFIKKAGLIPSDTDTGQMKEALDIFLAILKTQLSNRDDELNDKVYASLRGNIMAFAGSINKIPTNSFFCDGRELSRITYARLFEKIGTYWGAGNGTTTFNIPDGRSGVLMGAGYSNQWTHQENISLGQKVQTHMRKLVGDALHKGIGGHSYADYSGVYTSGIIKRGTFTSVNSVTPVYAANSLFWSLAIDSSLTQPSGNTFTPNAIGVNFIIFV